MAAPYNYFGSRIGEVDLTPSGLLGRQFPNSGQGLIVNPGNSTGTGSTGSGEFGDNDLIADKFGPNFGTAKFLGNAIGGLGNLAQGFLALKQLGLAKDSLEFQKEFSNRTFDAQRTTVNNRLNDQNAYKTAQGRTDLAKLVL